MAFTEKYASVAGGGAHDGTSEANAWTLAEAIAGAVAGDRVNIKAGSYSQGAATIATGTIILPLVWRGYTSTIGDLDDQGRNANGTLNTTNFPAITVTGTIAISPFDVLQNLSFTGALSTHLLGGSASDNWSVIRCSVTNTQNNAAARCIQGDNSCNYIGSDFYCSGAAHASVIDSDDGTFVYGCRIRGTSSSSLITANNGAVFQSLLHGGSGTGVEFLSAVSSLDQLAGNTFYGLGTGVTFPNLTPTGVPTFTNNHVTDCSKWIDNLNSGTAEMMVVERYTRIRDVTTPRTGVALVSSNIITTDGGGAETDFEDAGALDFHLISGAPGYATGSPPNLDIGAYQHTDPAGGGGAFIIGG